MAEMVGKLLKACRLLGISSFSHGVSCSACFCFHFQSQVGSDLPTSDLPGVQDLWRSLTSGPNSLKLAVLQTTIIQMPLCWLRVIFDIVVGNCLIWKIKSKSTRRQLFDHEVSAVNWIIKPIINSDSIKSTHRLFLKMWKCLVNFNWPTGNRLGKC